MAVEYDISSDVAAIKETGSVSQCARVTQMYSGQITYDDEAGSKFATATINGKSQRVMLCIAVNGTVTYDDVPSLYSTVDGHRCLNIVTPTETGTPDDVPSLYETVVIDGQNVRAVRCIMINKTPVYDGVSSTCTFTGDDGKTHTAQLVNKITGGSVQVIIKGTSPLNLPDAIANSLSYVKAFGGTEQRNLPDGYTQFGRIHFDGHCYFDTGIVINSLAATVKLIAAFDSQTSSSPCLIWGYMGSNSNLPCWGIGLYTDRWLTSPNGTLPYGTADTDKHIFITELYDNSGTPYWRTYVDGALLGGAAIVSSETITGNTLSTYIGARNNNGTAGNYVKGNFTYLEITQDGACLAKIYPCKRDSDNVLGLYNTVTNEFLPNLGTGTLTADIFASPTPDAPIDIVSNNGAIKFSLNLLDMAPENIVVGKYINNSGDEADNTANFYNNKFIPVSPNATYTWSTSESIKYINFMEYDSDQVFLQRTLIGSASTPAGTSGSITLTPNTAFVLIGSNMDGYNVTLDKITAVDWQFEKGSTATQYRPYGQTYTDGTVETIQAHGKNWWNPETDSYEAFYVTDGTQYTRYGHIYRNGTYTISRSSNSGNWIIYAKLVHNGVYGAALNVTPSQTRTLTATGDDQILVYASSASPADTTTYEVQVEKGSTVTTYEPYYDGGTATAEMLLKVDDYQDEQEILSGSVTRRVGAKPITGDMITSYFPTSNRCTIMTGDIITTRSPIICTHFPVATTGDYYVNHGNDNQYIYCYSKDCASLQDYKDFFDNQYAAGTPVIVVYPLATPTTESVAGQTLQVTDGDNALEITQASLDGLKLEARYDAAAQLTIQEVQDANLDNNVTVTIQ